MKFIYFLAAFAMLAVQDTLILRVSSPQVHPIVGCKLPLGITTNSQIENQIANTVGCSSVRTAVIDLVEVVPAMAMTELDRASNPTIASPVSTAWDLKVHDPFIQLNHPGPIAQISLLSIYASGTSFSNMNKIVIKRMPVVAPRGIHLARFIGAEPVTQTASGDPCNLLVTTLELFETKDNTGKPFQVFETYNLDGRGATAFSQDYTSWAGAALTPEELNDFDTDSLLLNKLVKVEITHRKEGKELVPVIANYLPHMPVTEQ